jgi:hypothetical protein
MNTSALTNLSAQTTCLSVRPLPRLGTNTALIF